MVLNVNISEHAARTLRALWGDRLTQAAFEGLLIESYRTGMLSAGELAEMLGLSTSLQGVAWLAERGAPLNYTRQDLENDRQTLADALPECRP